MAVTVSVRTDGRGDLRSVKFCALLGKVSLFLQMKEKLPSIYVIKHEVKFIIRLKDKEISMSLAIKDNVRRKADMKLVRPCFAVPNSH